jgi:RHS repeat-associated protein
LFTGAPIVKQQVTASFETGTEASNFRNYPNTSGINVIASNNTTAGGTKSQHLNGGYMGMVGVSKDYHVYPGDSVKISAKARYDAPTANASSLSSQFAKVLLNAYGLQPPPGGEVGTRAAALNSWGITAAGGYANGTGNDGYINAYVNIIIFDKNYKLVEFKAVPVTSSGTPTLISTGYLVKEEGYAFLYISNEQPVETSVYFDDVTFMYKPTSIIQYNEYYPFGLQTANSWTRENYTGNNYLFNGGTELNTTTGVMDLFYRNYDPALGRMNQVDPMAGKYPSYTPYNFSFNDPIYWNDPQGNDPPQKLTFWERLLKIGFAYDPWAGKIMDSGNAGGRTGSNVSTKEPTVYSKWCGCEVSAFEVLSYNGEGHQNEELKMAARNAIMDFFSVGKNSDRQVKQDATARELELGGGRNGRPNPKRYTLGGYDMLEYTDEATKKKLFGGMTGVVSNMLDFSAILDQYNHGNKIEAAARSIWLALGLATEYEALIAEGVIKIGQSEFMLIQIMENAYGEYLANKHQWLSYMYAYEKSDYKDESLAEGADRWGSKMDKSREQINAIYYRLLRDAD